MRGGDDDQALRVAREDLAASLRSLQVCEQTRDRIEVRVRIAVVPRAQGQEAEEMDEVVVEQEGESDASLCVVHRADHPLREVGDFNRNDVVVEAVGLPVPVMEGVKSVLAGELIERLHPPAREEGRSG